MDCVMVTKRVLICGTSSGDKQGAPPHRRTAAVTPP
jgi:hypothetical protein